MLTHEQLISLGQQVGYNVFDEGLCRGFSTMWAQAVCAGGLDAFNNRLRTLKKFAHRPQALMPAIIKVRQKAKDNGFDNLTPEEKALYEVPPFFEGIALYLNPEIGTELFGDKRLKQSDMISISNYLLPTKMEENQDRMVHAVKATSQFDEEALAAYLKHVGKVLNSRSDIPILLGANSHSVAIRVVGEDQFEYVDSNGLQLNKVLSSRELATQLYKNTWIFDESKPKLLIIGIDILQSENTALHPDVITQLKPFNSINSMAFSDVGGTIVLTAASRDDLEVLDRIDFERVDVNQPDRNGSSAIMIGFLFNQKEFVERLLTVPNIDVNGSYLETTLFYKAIETRSIAEKMIEVPSFDPNYAGQDGKAPLHMLCNDHTEHAPELAKRLLEKNADINKKDKSGNTALMLACAARNKQLVNCLIKNNANLNESNSEGYTALHNAVFSDNTNIVSQLLENGARVNQQTNGITPLSIAIILKREAILPMLLEKTAFSMDEIHSPQLYSLIEQCDTNSQSIFLKKILEFYGNSDSSSTAIDLNNKDPQGNTVLMKACQSQNEPLVAYLLKKGANPNSKNNNHDSALHYAVASRNENIVDMLLKANADSNQPNLKGLTPLRLAIQHKCTALIPKLLEYAAFKIVDLTRSSVLYKDIKQLDETNYKIFLKQALKCYINERINESDYTNFVKLGYAKDRKIDAAENLLKKLEGDESINLKDQEKILKNGRLGSLFNLYEDLSKPMAAKVEPDRFFKKAITDFKRVTKLFSSPKDNTHKMN